MNFIVGLVPRPQAGQLANSPSTSLNSQPPAPIFQVHIYFARAVGEALPVASYWQAWQAMYHQAWIISKACDKCVANICSKSDIQCIPKSAAKSVATLSSTCIVEMCTKSVA